MNTHRHAALLIALSALLTTPARAHHVVSESGIAWVEPVSVVEVETRTATFDFGPYFRGRWLTLTPSAEMTLAGRFSLTLRAPIAHIMFEDGRQVIGLADVETVAKARLWASEHGGGILSAGVGAEWPTGVVEDGLGGGHVELAPFLAGSTQPLDWLILSGVLSPRIALASEDDDAPHSYQAQAPHGALIAPHAPLELFTRLNLSAVRGRVYVTLGADHVLIFADASSVWRARAELGWSRARRWRVALGADTPLGRSQRSGVAWRVNAAWMF